MYRGGRPGGLARILNRITAAYHGRGILAPSNWVTLEVTGRRSGRTITFPLVVTAYRGERYLVSMLGADANWVRNVRAARGAAVLRRGDRRPVHLIEVPVGERAPILRRYLAVAPGARPHVTVGRRAPLAEFERVADAYPVFLIVGPDDGAAPDP